MIRITSFILSDGIINAPDQNGNVNQLLAKPTMLLKPQFIPSALSFCFALGVAGIDITKDGNKLKLTVMDPDENEVFTPGEMNIPVDAAAESMPVEQRGCLICMDMRNVAFRMEGVFHLRVEVNGEFIGNCEIPVYLCEK